MELAFAEDRHRDTWRRLRRAVDQARSFSDTTGGTLRGFLRWVELQREDSARVAEALVPEADDDAVRVMTVHSAKGLEFPFVVVAGFTGTRGPRRGGRTSDLVFPSVPGYLADVPSLFCKMGGRVKTSRGDIINWEAREKEQEFHEDIRKLYVACTRAEDYLAVSLYRVQRGDSWKKDRMLTPDDIRRKLTLAELLAQTVAEVADPEPEVVPHPLVMAVEEDDDSDESDGNEQEQSPKVLSQELERNGWPAGRPVETLRPGESPLGAISADPLAGPPKAGSGGPASRLASRSCRGAAPRRVEERA